MTDLLIVNISGCLKCYPRGSLTSDKTVQLGCFGVAEHGERWHRNEVSKVQLGNSRWDTLVDKIATTTCFYSQLSSMWSFKNQKDFERSSLHVWYVSSREVLKAGTHRGMYKYLLNLGKLQINISGPETSVTPESHTEPLPGNRKAAVAAIGIGQSSASRKETLRYWFSKSPWQHLTAGIPVNPKWLLKASSTVQWKRFLQCGNTCQHRMWQFYFFFFL